MKKVKNSWAWTPGQIVSVVILVGATVGLLGTGLAALLFPEYVYSVSPVGLIIFGAVAAALLIVYVGGNVRLKRRSTVFMEIPDDGYETHVWMAKPNQQLYKGILDKNRNKGSLAGVKRVKAVVMGKNDMFQFVLKNDRNLWIPGRLLAEAKVRAFVQKAIDANGGITFDSKKTEQALKSRLSGEKRIILTPEAAKPIQMSSEDQQFEKAQAAKKARTSNS